jgi:UDP-N-acetylmuramate dehydrogenase
LFKKTDRYVVVRVRFAMREGSHGTIRYSELARALGRREGDRAPLSEIRATVIALRRSKGMVLDPDDPDSVSAGSFFVNPVLAEGDLARLEARAEGERVPRFAAEGGRWKVPAAWLVERAGFAKGYGDGKVGVSRKHALALVHRGGGTTRELVALAREIKLGVRLRLGVELTPEPVFVGTGLDA